MWRVYQRGLEQWLADLLQPVLDNLVAEAGGAVPKFIQRLRILEFTLDHEAPYFSNMRRRTSRKDSDLNGVVDVRYPHTRLSINETLERHPSFFERKAVQCF